MTAFVITSIVLAVLALAWVLAPLWRDKPLAGGGLLAGLLLVTGALYWQVGTPRALDPAARKAPQTLDQAIARIRAELERNPEQAQGWRLLARAYATQGRSLEARDAYARALQVDPDNPAILTAAAEARALAAKDHRFDPRAVAMLQRALAIQPEHQRARWFLGIAQRQSGQPRAAAATWQPLLAMVGPDAAASLREQINLARSDAGMSALSPPSPSPAPLPAPAAAAITVSVSLDPALAMRYPDGASVFVIAKQPGGPPMPVAVEKLQPDTFPLQVTLDDGDSPMPTVKLSALDRVQLSARVSASGNAIAQPGDFESAPVLVEVVPGASAALLIDQVVE